MSDVNIDHIEALVGPLPRRREWERWCEYTQPLSLPERGKADAALAEAYEKIQELDDKLMEAEGAHENARRWFEEQKKQFARAEKATEYARIEVKRKNEAVEREAAAIERAEAAEAEAERLRSWQADGEPDMVRVQRERAEKAEAEVEALKCCGNCRHWWPGLLGCALDSSQEVVCEGRDRCKVFVQLADRPETREPSWTRRES